MESSVPRQFRPDVPFNERWELLKPCLEQLYLGEKRKVPEIVEIMKEQYGFDANGTQYKYQFGRKWGWKKNVPASKKENICEVGQTRAALGKSTIAKYKGKEVDPKKLRRHAKETARKGITLSAAADGVGSRPGGLFSSALPFGNKIFLNWNMPYGALNSSRSRDTGHSPFGQFVSTPGAISDVSMATPPANSVPSPNNAPSPLSVALRKKTAIDRAHLFVQGKHDDLIRSMDKTERRVMSTWLYQFWLFSFRTAKYWGRGPRDWTADNLGFNMRQGPISIPSPNTPDMIADSPEAPMGQRNADLVQKPSPLCRWSIHICEEEYEPIPSPSPDRDFPNPHGESLAEWSESWKEPSFEERLRNGLESNDFSIVKADQLPLAVPQVAKAAERSPNEFLEEALGFAIMGGNFDLVNDLISKVNKSKVDISGLYPYHLATSYLSGSKSCCNIFLLLCQDHPVNFVKLYVNKLGHTVLDNLMIAILKGHTSILPGSVDDALKGENRFAGEEIDICGRWEADSDCFRELLASGRSSIPFEWKHKFCHTSVQVICHCIETIVDVGATLDTASGLFLKYCLHCGQKLELFPLHTLVLTAFHLAQFGCEGEDLFGVVACLLCLLSRRASPQLKAHISVTTLLGEEQIGHCDHEEVTPAELTTMVPTAITGKWSNQAKTGWHIFCHVLRIAQDKYPWQGEDCLDANSLYPLDCSRHLCLRINSVFSRDLHFGHIWAAMQTEMLTYRRLGVMDPWISENFDMDNLLESLETGTEVSIGLVKGQMMKPYCPCGSFGNAFSYALREEAAAYYFSNLDDWNRTAFIPFVFDII